MAEPTSGTSSWVGARATWSPHIGGRREETTETDDDQATQAWPFAARTQGIRIGSAPGDSLAVLVLADLLSGRRPDHPVHSVLGPFLGWQHLDDNPGKTYHLTV